MVKLYHYPASLCSQKVRLALVEKGVAHRQQIIDIELRIRSDEHGGIRMGVIVHELPGAWGLPSVSPFCLKLQTWLRVAGVPYTTVVDATPFRAPKGKLPYIEH